jgi:hypothetical protein
MDRDFHDERTKQTMKRYRAKDMTQAAHPRYEGKGNQQQRGAVSPGTIEPNATVLQPPPAIEPARIVSGASTSAIKSADGPSRSFTLPDRISAAELLAQSRRYGGSR